MLVLIDLEWIKQKDRFFSATQLAAVRVDDRWEAVDEFHSLIKPPNYHFHQWDHIAYSGSGKKDYLAAPLAGDVILAFQKWLKADDILLWWHNSSLNNYEHLLRCLLKAKVQHECHVISPIFERYIKDGIQVRGSLYDMARLRGIPLLTPEHDAVNDVTMFRSLLRHTGFTKDLLYQPIFEQGQTSTSISTHPYHIDPTNSRVHCKGCPVLPPSTRIIGCDTLYAAYKRGLKPCPICCKEAWRSFLIEKNTAIISKTQYNYYHLLSSRVFHRPTCRMIQEAIAQPHGTVYYSTCIEAGRTPCKLCKPTPGDQTLAKVKAEKISSETLLPRAPQTTRRVLTASEKQAVKRHNQAVKERASLDMSEMTIQEREDALTLTSTRFAFWAVPGYESFHTRNCSKLTGLSGLQGYARYAAARYAGFKPCRLCKPSSKQDATLSIPIYNQERDDESVTEFINRCEAYGFTCSFDENAIVLNTPIARWRFDPWKKPIQLMHQHTEASPRGMSTEHRQPRLFLSLHDVLQYIVKHDLSDN